MESVISSVANFHAGQGQQLQPQLESLAKNGQQPKIMMITCADSRILLDPLVDSQPGVVFTVRNVGNLVPSAGTDPSVAAAVEYAISALKVPDIVVMGHSECGAMKALLGDRIEGPIGDWLEHGKDSVEKLKSSASSEGAPQHDQLSQQNVLTQVERLRAMPSVQNAGVKVHAWWWDMANARVLAYDGEKFGSVENAYNATATA